VHIVQETVAIGASSSDTAWVAAIGVIGGATISGIVAVLLALVQRKSLDDQASRQNQSQRDLFMAQTTEEQRKWQLELRRGAYVEYLVSVENLRELITPLNEQFEGSWPRRDGVSDVEAKLLDSLTTQFLERCTNALRCGQLVRLAGPQDVILATQDVFSAITRLRSCAEERFRDAKANVKPADERAWPNAIQGIVTSVEAFISQASAILGSTPVTGEPSPGN
jgi:hypothetical protein